MDQRLGGGVSAHVVTLMDVGRPNGAAFLGAITLSDDPDNLDGLNYLGGQKLDEINWKAYEGTREAHGEGGVPCLSLQLDRVSPEAVGGLLYLFEKGVAVGGRLRLALDPGLTVSAAAYPAPADPL